MKGEKIEMLETKYYKDYKHNYLIIKDNGCLSENVYQRKMMTENKIDGLISSSEKHINGELLLYFEITSKQSLRSLFDGKTIGIDFLHKFFIRLKMMNDVLQKYLLDGNCLVLLPEYIFQDIGTKDMYFLYYPDSEEGSLDDLMDFFIKSVDSEDLEAVETVYRMADLVKKEQFVLDEVLEWFQDDHREENISDLPEPGRMTEKADIWEENNKYTEQQEEPYSEISRQDEREPEGEKRIIRILPLIAFAVAAAGVLTHIMCFYQLSYQEEIYLIAGWGVVIAMLLGSAGWYILPHILKRKGQRVDKAETPGYRYVPTYENSVLEDTEAEVGNTVFIPWTENCENKLYGTDWKNKYHIDLNKLPLTVGKLAGMVDMTINEQSISRMHARFSRSGNKIYITDLNSTNGTFRNGVRLTPNSSEMIEPGDEIRLGKLKFIYR